MANSASSSDLLIAALEEELYEDQREEPFKDLGEEFFEFPDDITVAWTLPTQGVAAQFTQAAGTSTGVSILRPREREKMEKKDLMDPDLQVGAESPSRKGTGSPKSPSTRKRLAQRESDKRYQNKRRCKREKMVNDLSMLETEIEDLKRKNGLLRSEKDLMDKKLPAGAAENQRLESELCKLRGKISEQKFLVDALQRKLPRTNHEDDQQLINLRNENARLHQNVTWTGQMEEKKQLLDGNVDLERQIRLLKFQVQAICRTYKDK